MKKTAKCGLKCEIWPLLLLPTFLFFGPRTMVAETEQPACDAECVRKLLAQAESEAIKIRQEADTSARKLKEIGEASPQKGTPERAAGPWPALGTNAEVQFFPAELPSSPTGPATREEVAPAKIPGKEEAAVERVPAKEQSGLVKVGDVVIGIYHFPAQAITLDVSYHDDQKLGFDFSPYELDRFKLTSDREFFIKSCLPNTQPDLLSIERIPDDEDKQYGTEKCPNNEIAAVRKIYPDAPVVNIGWIIRVRSYFAKGSFKTSVQAWLGSRPVSSSEKIEWKTQKADLASEVTIKAAGFFSKDNLERAGQVLGLLGSGGILGILTTLGFGRKSKAKDQTNAPEK